MSAMKPILIIEDDRDIRENLQEVLELEGYAVLTAGHGKEALELLASQSPSQNQCPGLILLDWMMPVMDGRTFLAEFRGKLPDIASATPVVLFTAMGDRNPVDLPVASTLRKPIDLDELIRLVATYCNPT